MTDTVLQTLDTDAPHALDRLRALLAIPSVSTDPAYRDGIGQASQWLADTLADAGLDVEIRPTDGHPVVLGRTPQARWNDSATHVLFYGHYDVQPPDPLELWESGPFEPVISNDAIVARGASDDKGQIMCFIEALRAWQRNRGGAPVNVTVLIEGEEEMGSAHLPAFLDQNKQDLTADFVLISDTTMWDTKTVAITYGLRGMVYYDLKLHGPSRDLHSGMYGGTLANPATMLTRVLGQLFDDQHRVCIPGFYDHVVAPRDDEREAWANLTFDPVADLLRPVGVETPFGEANFSTLERRWSRPACDINGLYGGYGGEGAKTIIPNIAGAKVSFRLAPNQQPEHIAAAFEQWLRSHDVHGCRWELTQMGMAEPVLVSTNSPYMAIARRAIEKSSGRKPVLVREGATIPVVADFKHRLNLDSLLIGFGLPDDQIHSPNEKFRLSNFALGCRTHAVLMGELGQANKP